MRKLCFVLQPFDKGKYDRRYKEIIEPVIKECGLIPYRVDEDHSSIIPIESIHTKIKESSICIAEVTTDNPNVWYELGYALALEKSIVILCSEERATQFPFDIRHRNILNYKTQTLSDFKELKSNLKNRINAYLILEYDKDNNSDLDDFEIIVLKAIWNNQNTPYEIISKDKITKGNADNVYIVSAIRKLIFRKFVEYVYNSENGIMKSFYRVTIEGEKWIQKNDSLMYKR